MSKSFRDLCISSEPVSSEIYEKNEALFKRFYKKVDSESRKVLGFYVLNKWLKYESRRKYKLKIRIS